MIPTVSDSSEADIRFDMTVNAIVRQHPATLAVFTRMGIDTCCGGALSLAEVARRHRIDFIVLLAELDAV